MSATSTTTALLRVVDKQRAQQLFDSYSDSIEQAQLYYDHSFGKAVVLMESAEALQEIAYIVSDETLMQVFHSV